ncbi:MAG: CHRD domain-containing protein [Candidatus Eiseniibacteriota bacterium]
MSLLFRRSALALSLGLALAVCSLAPPVEAARPARPGPLQLTAENVVPGPGDFGALVEGKIGFGREACFEFVVTAPLAGVITRIAIHEGAAGFEGPEVVALNPMRPGIMGLNGCVPIDRELGRQISRNKAGYYVVVKTTAYPNGAVRAQLANR